MAANVHPLFISVACWVSSELLLLTFLSPYCPVKWFWWRKVQLTQLTIEWQLAGIGEAGFLIALLLCELLRSSSASPSLLPASPLPNVLPLSGRGNMVMVTRDRGHHAQVTASLGSLSRVSYPNPKRTFF